MLSGYRMLRCAWILLTGCSASNESEPDATPHDSATPADHYYRDVTNTHLDIAALTSLTMDSRAADFDGDGDLDVLLAMEFRANILLINVGGQFVAADPAKVPPDVHDSEDIGVADFDNDGDLDAVVVTEDDRINELYINQGNATFVAAGDRLPVEGVSNAVAIADVNRDGLPDMVIGNNGQNFLLMNDRGIGFTDATAERLPAIEDITQDLEFGDVDNDGDLDLLVGNEDRNRLLINNGSGVFTDESRARIPLTGATEETREADFGDIDGDGDLDILFANVELFAVGAVPANRLLINDGTGSFTDESADRLPADMDLSFDGDFVDLDADGDLDIATANGLRRDTPYRAYRNNGAGVFTDVTSVVFPSAPTGRGFDIEAFDADNDGRNDLYFASRGSADRLLLATTR